MKESEALIVVACRQRDLQKIRGAIHNLKIKDQADIVLRPTHSHLIDPAEARDDFISVGEVIVRHLTTQKAFLTRPLSERRAQGVRCAMCCRVTQTYCSGISHLQKLLKVKGWKLAAVSNRVRMVCGKCADRKLPHVGELSPFDVNFRACMEDQKVLTNGR